MTVVGYGTDRFPAFYNRDSGLPVDVRADTPAEVAALFRAQRALGLPCGMLVTVPIPAEFEPPADQMEAAIAQALAEAEAQGIKGKAMTPFLLARVSALTGEASLRANLALLENNARVAAEIAVALARETSRQEYRETGKQGNKNGTQDAGCPVWTTGVLPSAMLQSADLPSAIRSLLSAICHLQSAPPAAPPRSVPAAGRRRWVPACRRRSPARPRSPCHHP